jgi:uncharacterized protein
LKLHLDKSAGINAFTGYGLGFVMVNGIRYDKSLVVLPDTILEDWVPSSLEALTANDLQQIMEFRPEILLLGTGTVQRFPSRPILQALVQAQIGLEVMDNSAACRTYNVLAGEDRRVAAALMMAPPT